MNLSGIAGVLLLAAGVVAGLILLPGLSLKVFAFVRRRRESPAILGPLFWHELVTVTRRGTQVRLRVGYSLLLLAGLAIAFLSQFREVNPIRLILSGGDFPRERVTAFATTFFQIFLFCQLSALTLVAPVFAGASLIDEKDRGTLAFLQTSLLSNREIVLGKLAARVFFVLALALAGLPVLAISLHFGGVDPEILAASFAAATLATISLAAFSFWQATRHDSMKVVLANSYTLAIALFFMTGCCLSCLGVGSNLSAISPFVLLIASVNPGTFRSFDLFEATMLAIAIHAVLTLFFAILAMGNVRAILLRNPVPPKDSPKWKPANGPRWVEAPGDGESTSSERTRDHVRRERPPPRFVRIPPIDDDQPFLWKERHFGGKLPSFETDALRGLGLALFVAAFLPALFGAFATAASSDRPQDVINPLFRVVCVVLVVFVIPLAGARTVGCVANERQRQTLDSLFAIPVDRSRLLEAKAWAALLWLRHWAIGYALVALFALLTGSMNLDGFLIVSAAIAAAVPFFLTLAVWLSVRCESTARATAWYVAAAFALFLLPPLLAVLVGGAAELLGGSPRFFESFATATSLPFGVSSIAAISSEGRDSDWFVTLAGLHAAALGFVLLSIILWRAAVRRFEREGK